VNVAQWVARVRREEEAMVQQLLADVSAGLRVLRTRDGLPVTEEMVAERSANIVCALVGNYRIEPLTGVSYARRPVVTEEDFKNEGRIR
jgi:hypothetical protein